MHIFPLGVITTANGSENATDLDNATHVYVVEKNNAEAVITITDAGGTIKASFGLAGKDHLTFSKFKTDKVYSNTSNSHFTKIGYTN